MVWDDQYWILIWVKNGEFIRLQFHNKLCVIQNINSKFTTFRRFPSNL